MSPSAPLSKFPAPLHKALTGSVIPLGSARVLVGAFVLARPSVLATSLGVDAVTAQRTAWIARFFASRDLALGMGVVAGSRSCQVAACASDASDFVAIVVALKGRHVRPVPAILVAATAAGAAIAGAAVLNATRG